MFKKEFLISSVLKQTKANIKWMKVNNKKVNILLDNGLHMDEIKVVARYIGSCSHDKKYVCPHCGEIYSLKQHKNRGDIICNFDPVEIERRKNMEWLLDQKKLERKQEKLDKEQMAMIKKKEEEDYKNCEIKDFEV